MAIVEGKEEENCKDSHKDSVTAKPREERSPAAILSSSKDYFKAKISADHSRGARKEPGVTTSNSPMNSSMVPLLDPCLWSCILLGIIWNLFSRRAESGEKVLDPSHNNQSLPAVFQRPQMGVKSLERYFVNLQPSCLLALERKAQPITRAQLCTVSALRQSSGLAV